MQQSVDLEEVRFLRAQGASHDEIARQLGVTTDGIRAAIRRHTVSGRGICSVCGADAGVNGDGLVRVHGWVAGEDGNCVGSHRDPLDLEQGMPEAEEPEIPSSDPDAHHWSDRAACRGEDPEMFFSTDSRDAKRVCRRCPVQAECLESSADLAGGWGVWGGLTDRERRNHWRAVARRRTA